jgi:hypothetical protein
VFRRRFVGTRVGRGLFVAGLAALIAAPSTAVAAKPFVLDGTEPARLPDVAVDAAGTGHFVWNDYRGIVNADVLRYCQVPRNGRQCTKSRSFTLPNTDFAGPRILVHPDGRLIIYSLRCCGAGPPFNDPNLDLGYVTESSDGGTTWSDPVPTGSGSPAGGAAVGPGQFSISVVSDVTTGGVIFQAIPLGQFTQQKANVGDRGLGVNNPGIAGGIGFVDPLTPIVAVDDLSSVYFRKWGGLGSNYNDLATWGPLVEVAQGGSPRLASGKRGVYLIYTTPTFPKQIRVGRFNGTGFGPFSAVTPKGDPIFAAFSQDAGGNLSLSWQENGADELRYRVSKDGKTFAKAQVLATAKDGQFFHQQISAAKDAGGFIVWDANGKGPVRAIQFGPTGPVSGGGGGQQECVPEVDVGAATVLAREGCLQRKGSKYTTKGDVRVNGIDFSVPSGTAITVDTSARTITSTGKVEAKVGNVKLDDAAIGWKVPQGGGQILRSDGQPAFFDTGKFGIEFLGLPISGQTTAKVKPDGSVEIPANLGLPSPFGGLGGLGSITGGVTLRANNDQGLILSGFTLRAKDVGVGIASIDELALDYSAGDDTFTSHGVLSLPVVGSGLEADFGLRQGKFDYLRGNFPLPAGGVPVATQVFLREIGFEVQGKTPEHPTKLAGSLTFGGGPKIGDIDLIAVKGTVSYTFPDAPNPGVFRVEGDGSIVDIQVATIFAQYVTSGAFTFGLDLGLGSEQLGIFGGVDGGMDLANLKWQMHGFVKGCVVTCFLQVEMLASSKAMAACAFGISVIYEWGEGLDGGLGCDLDEYKVLHIARLAQTGTQTVTLPKGLPAAALEITGNGGPPRVTITGPGGASIETPLAGPDRVTTPVGILVTDRARNRTLVRLNKPAAGAWQITQQAGSPAITSVRRADGLPAPKITAKVTGKGRKRKLEYTVTPIDGERVTFQEEGRNAYADIAPAKASRGRQAFTPADGPAGKRRIFALVEQNGVPRDRIEIASYTAPGPLTPGRPPKVKLKRSGTKLVVSWGKATAATSYAVRVVLRDGRRLVIPTRRRSVRLSNVASYDRGTISVYGMRAGDRMGPAATVKLKERKKKKR